MCFFFFFKQKTADDMRISDWSSDVCSSDLAALRAEAVQWFNLERSGDMTVDDELRFLEWLDRSDTHRDAYRLVERAWLIAGTIAQEPEMLPSADTGNERESRRSGWRRHLALAASLLLVFTLGWTAYLGVFPGLGTRSEEHTSELQSLMRISYAVFCLN